MYTVGTNNSARVQSHEPRLDLLVVGEACVDLVLRGLPRVPFLGTEAWAEEYGWCPGGVATVAIAAARLGCRVGLTAPFGDDELGRFCRNWLMAEGIDLSSSRILANTPNPLSVILSGQDDRAIASVSPITVPLMDQLPDAHWIFTGMGKSPDATIWAPITAAQGRGARVACTLAWSEDPVHGIDALPIPPNVDLLIGNEQEALMIAGTTSPVDAATALRSRATNVVVTLGPKGALVATPTEITTITLTRPHAVRDTTGAGDVFCGALLAGWIHGSTLVESIMLGHNAAGFSLQHIGGVGAPTNTELSGLYPVNAGRRAIAFPSL